MSFLVDTCGLSELVKPRPSRRVVDWFDTAPPETLFISTLTLGEIRKGVERLRDSPRRSRIAAWLEIDLPAWFKDRVLAVDRGVADEWGRMMGRIDRPVPAIDGLMAATALRHRLSIVTRNVRDFEVTGVDLIDPWKAS